MKKLRFKKTVLFVIISFLSSNLFAQHYPIVETGQTNFYDSTIIVSPITQGSPFFGQDANYTGNEPSYTDNGDGTITDNVTGLMWSKTPDLDGDGDIDYDDKLSFEEALTAADTFSLAGYSDWRLPTIKEQYSLILFTGIDPSGYTGTSTDDLTPFIDTNYFDFNYGDQDAGERIIDAQMATSTLYVGTTMAGDETMFGVNFADGRIKGYPTGPMMGQTEDKQFFVYFVRGNTNYGINDFQDNSDGTITDNETGLMWMQDDNGEGVTWEEALAYAEGFEFAGYSDWRLPNVKELQSIVDYTRSPQTNSSAAIDPLFNCSSIIDEGGNTNYPFYWSSTTHENMSLNPGSAGAYVCFGEALGWMEEPPMSGNYTLMDVHGAGAQRSDPKVGNPDDYPYGNGPQGDVIRIYNYVRLVRGEGATLNIGSSLINNSELNVYPNPTSDYISVNFTDNNLENTNIFIYNNIGQLIITENVCNNTKIDVSSLQKGIYIIKIASGSTIVSTKFVKK